MKRSQNPMLWTLPFRNNYVELLCWSINAQICIFTMAAVLGYMTIVNLPHFKDKWPLRNWKSGKCLWFGGRRHIAATLLELLKSIWEAVYCTVAVETSYSMIMLDIVSFGIWWYCLVSYVIVFLGLLQQCDGRGSQRDATCATQSQTAWWRFWKKIFWSS